MLVGVKGFAGSRSARERSECERVQAKGEAFTLDAMGLIKPVCWVVWGAFPRATLLPARLGSSEGQSPFEGAPDQEVIMLEFLFHGEIRPSRLLKLAMVFMPFLFILVILGFVSFSKWKERKIK